MNREKILKEFYHLVCEINEVAKYGIDYDSKPQLVIFICNLIDQAEKEKKKTRQDIVNGFIQEFCNDHNGKIRWLRSIAVSDEHLLEKILDYFNSQTKEDK